MCTSRTSKPARLRFKPPGPSADNRRSWVSIDSGFVWSTTCERAPQLQEALAQLVAGQLVDGSQSAVAQVVDVVDLDVGIAARESEQILDGRDQVLGAQRHFVLGHVELQFPIDAEAAYLAQPIAIRIEEFLMEQRPRLFELGR